MQVKEVLIETLHPFEGNPRSHDKDIDFLVKSIAKFGWTNPVLVQKKTNRIIAGHGRLIAAKKAGLKKIPVIYLDLNNKEASAYTITDNRSAEGSEWSFPKLKDLLVELDDGSFDLSLTGFDEGELKKLIDWDGEQGITPEDEVPDPPKKPKTKTGDVFQLGDHILVCGDSTIVRNIEKLFNFSTSPVILLTDPPYGVNYDPSWREGSDLGIGKRSKGKVANDDNHEWGEVYRFINAPIAYVWHGGKFTAEVAQTLKALDYEIISQIIWVKQHFVISRGDYHWQHEPCWYAVK